MQGSALNCSTEVVGRVTQIIEALKIDPAADIKQLREEIDDRIFELFEITTSRQVVLDYYAAVGRVEATDEEEADAAELMQAAQAAIE